MSELSAGIWNAIVKHGASLSIDDCVVASGLSKKKLHGSFYIIRQAAKLVELAFQTMTNPSLEDVRKFLKSNGVRYFSGDVFYEHLKKKQNPPVLPDPGVVLGKEPEPESSFDSFRKFIALAKKHGIGTIME